MHIGIDVGGTNTDAVLVDKKNILSAKKSFTTRDVISGIKKSTEALFENNKLSNTYYFAHGGYEYDGRTISALKQDEIRKIAKKIHAGILMPV